MGFQAARAACPAEVVIEALRPIQARHAELMADTGELDQVLAEGAARAISNRGAAEARVVQVRGGDTLPVPELV